MIKGKFKRLMAMLLSVLMIAGIAPVSAFAAESSAAITFAYMYQSDGSQIVYQQSFTGTHGTDGAPGRAMTQIYANGQEAYCIEPGAPLHTGDTLTANASETWNNLGAAKQNAIKTALAFGKPGNEGGLSGSGDAKHLATQMIVWEFVCGYRDLSSYSLSNSCIYDAFCSNGANAEVAANYNAIVRAMKNWNVTPSFANGSTYEMAYKDGKYTVTITDTNGVIGDYSVSCSDSSVRVSKSGNSITITCDSYMAQDPTITVSKSSNISASAVLVPYGSASLQDVVTGVTRVGDVSASFKVTTPGGTMKLVKTSEDGVIAGIKMTVTGNGYNKVVTTGADGTISIEGLIPGTYTVSEAVASYYEPQDAQSVTITSGHTSTVTFNNTLKRGSLSVSKTSEDGFTEGMRFHLFGTSASGANVDLYATTDSTGVATFKDVLIAGVSGYTLEEVDTAIRYVIPEDQNVTVTWNEMTGSTVTNILKKFNVTVYKSDAETETAQGDATLAGAVYGIYQDGSLVDTYTTDANGSFTTDYYVCGNTWTIREITPSEGYLVDEREYHIGAEPENYEIELNQAPSLNSYEQVIKGNIAIIKHSDDGSTQIETPEEGAAFEIYLASAGSYDAAKESERDILICDADGFAQSKDLPYGQYTVHQTEGWDETEFMRDFTVFISENGKTYKYLINNAPYQAYIKVVKADVETGRTIPMAGAGFEIYDANGNKVSMSYTYPTLTTIDTFYVSEDGYLITPQKLDAGNYSLVEVQAPYGYVLNSEPVSFTVTSADNEDVDGLCVIEVTAYDMAQKGTISITKSGEVFVSVNVTGEEGVIDKEGNWGIIDPTYAAVYEVRNLSRATYQVIAAEDIYTGDGTLRVAAGTVVADMTTNGDGIATTGELYLGKYRVVETKAPYGFTLNEEEQLVELTYAGQEISITSSSASYVNDRQKLEISATKQMEQDELYGIGMNGEITAVSFGLYAKEDIVALDESVIPADGLLEIAFADENGDVSFHSDLPFGSYYVKELTTDIHYDLNETVYQFEFRVLKKLMERSNVTELIEATDAGREGELIFRLVYHQAGCKKPFKRLWISSMEDSAIKAGFQDLRPSSEYDRLYAAALARSQADWLVGMNGTRLFTKLYDKKLTVGRVQTPTLTMVVDRQKQIDGFQKQKYWNVHLMLDGADLVKEKHFDKAEAERIAEECRQHKAIIKKTQSSEKDVSAPRLYDLTTLQREANRYFGYTAQKTLDYTQSLYEQKLVTYPRTDSQFLSDDMYSTAEQMVQLVKQRYGVKSIAPHKPDISRILNSSKVSDHHAIIPTAEIEKQELSRLAQGERDILLLISMRLLAATGAKQRIQETELTAACSGYEFKAKGKSVLDPGWKVYEDMLRDMIGGKKTEAEKMLPVLVEGQSFENPETSVTEHQTSPPKAYTEDTLLSALETAGNDCFDEDTEKKGLGTPATRAAMIEKLVANQYIRRKGKQLVPTEDGLAMAELLPEEIKSPKLTADWENALMQIERGETSSEAFMADICGLVRTLVSKYGTAGKMENNPFTDIARPQREQIGVCPRCGSPVYEGEKNYYCSAQGCSFCIWKESRWLSGMKKKITKKMATTLLKDGRVYVTGFYSERKGRCFDAFLVLDDTGKQVNFKLDFDGKKAARNKKKG